MDKKTPKPSTYLWCGVGILLILGMYWGFYLGLITLAKDVPWLPVIVHGVVMAPISIVCGIVGAWYIQLSGDGPDRDGK